MASQESFLGHPLQVHQLTDRHTPTTRHHVPDPPATLNSVRSLDSRVSHTHTQKKKRQMLSHRQGTSGQILTDQECAAHDLFNKTQIFQKRLSHKDCAQLQNTTFASQF